MAKKPQQIFITFSYIMQKWRSHTGLEMRWGIKGNCNSLSHNWAFFINSKLWGVYRIARYKGKESELWEKVANSNFFARNVSLYLYIKRFELRYQL